MGSPHNYNQETGLNSIAAFNLVYLHPDPEKCLGRVSSLSKVDGLESNEVEVLNDWFVYNWKKIFTSGFLMNDSLTRDFTNYLQQKSPILVDLDKVESYLSVQKLLYNGLRLELEEEDSENENVSQCKLFHKYYYSCRENPLSLNNMVVLSNVIWSLRKYKSDEFALTCLVDILMQSYMAALSSFISLGGVDALRETLEYLAHNDRLKQSTNFLLKCMDLLDKLDINFKVLQTSKIGIPVNCIALGKSHAKLKLDYECSNDKVKLKATNLIKKWKAIRDASLPSKPSIEVDNKMKKIHSADGRMLKKQADGSFDKRTDKQPSDRRFNDRADSDKTSHADSTNHEPEGSFVLNIINTMVEQKEKEKKRKLEIRNSQLSSKYKATATKTKPEVETKPEKSSSSDKLDRKKSVETEPEKEKPNAEDDQDNSSTTQLASLLNFFKEFSNKSEGRPDEEDVQQLAGLMPQLTSPVTASAAQQLVSSMASQQLGQAPSPQHLGAAPMPPMPPSGPHQMGPNVPSHQFTHNIFTHVPPNMGPSSDPQSGAPQSMAGVPSQPLPPPPPPNPQMLGQVVPPPVSPPPPPPPPVMGNMKHMSGGFSNAMDGMNEPHGFKDFRGRMNDQPNVFNNFQAFGQVMPPTGYVPPPPPPPPGHPSGPQHFSGPVHDNQTGFDMAKSRFSGHRSKFHSPQSNFHPPPPNYDENSPEKYVADKHIEFYRSGSEPPKDEGQGPVIPPWK